MKKSEIINMLADALPRNIVDKVHNDAVHSVRAARLRGLGEEEAMKVGFKALIIGTVVESCMIIRKTHTGRPRKKQ